MIFTETKLKGAYIIELKPLEDERGFFARSFCQKEFEEHGLNPRIVQCNISLNKKKGTLRGMHHQVPPHEEAKLVSCIRGAIYDVIIDLRPDSTTYCQWFAAELSAENYKMVYIPEGFAHGFQTLEDDTVVFYQMSEFYRPESARGVRWDDPVFGIKWPINNIIISKQDTNHKTYNPYQKKIIQTLKLSKPQTSLKKNIHIFNENNNRIGQLKVLDKKLANNKEIIRMLTKWRNMFMNFFLTRFVATNERTQKWINKIVLPSNDRILFLIYDEKGNAIGHVGLCSIDNDSAELDNLIRGEIGGDPRLIYYAEVTLLRWIFEMLKVNRIYGFVLSNNFIPLNLDKSIGFKLSELIPLYKTEQDGEILLKKGAPDKTSPDGLYVQKVELDFLDFSDKFPNLFKNSNEGKT